MSIKEIDKGKKQDEFYFFLFLKSDLKYSTDIINHFSFNFHGYYANKIIIIINMKILNLKTI